MSIIVGGVVIKDDKYLLVQESNERCYGKWSLPAGHLDAGETIFNGAKREVKEETNCDVELTGICQIGNQIKDNEPWVAIVFTTELVTADARPQPGEILDLGWFSYDEVIAMQDRLRAPEWIISAITNQRNGKIAPLDLVDIIDNRIIN